MIRHFGVWIPLVFCAFATLLSYEWLGFFLFFYIPLIGALRRGWFFVMDWIVVFSILLGGLLAWEGFQTREMIYAFLGLGLAFSSSVWKAWMERQLGRSFIDHRLSWFEGGPRLNARVTCEIEGLGACRIARLDREGTFLFPTVDLPNLSQKTATVRLQDDYGTAEVGTKIMRLDQGGVGMKFLFSSMDQRKALGDLVERFQGAGNEI